MKNSVLLILLCVFHSSFAQQRLSGKVVDSVTGQPVPYASIAVIDANSGATSNELGEFDLSIPSLPIKLIVSELAHVRDTVEFRNTKFLSIKLAPASVALPEVQVDTYVETLIRQAYRKLQNHRSQTRYGKAFYRQTTGLGEETSEVQEMVWEAKVNSVGIAGTALSQGRYAEKKGLIQFKSFSVYTKGVDITNLTTDSMSSKLLVSLNPAIGHTLHLVRLNEDGERKTAEIEFVNKAKPSSRGSIVIDVANYQILRFRLETSAFQLKSPNPTLKLKNQIMNFEWLFQPTVNSTSNLTSVKVVFQALMSKPLQKDVTVRVSSVTSLYDMQQTPPTGVMYGPASIEIDDLNTIKKLPYNADFWRNSTTIKRTPVEEDIIKAFERSGAFGTILSN